jgi:hypothetical protein
VLNSKHDWGSLQHCKRDTHTQRERQRQRQRDRDRDRDRGQAGAQPNEPSRRRPPYCSRGMFGEKATAMVERLQRATWLPPYDDTMREVLTEIDELHAKANDWLQ